MLPILAVVAVCVFLVLHFTGVLDDLGRRATRVGPSDTRALNPARQTSTDSETDRRLKVFESFIENLTKPDDDREDEAGTARPDDSSKD